MGLKINTNITALTAHNNMLKNDNQLSESLLRLSTGLRINKSADDVSGMAIADTLRSQHLGIGQAIRNANDALSVIQVADGSLEESINILNTMKTKTIQAASDTQTSETRLILQNDINKLMEELDNIVKNTSFNGQKLLSGAFTNKSIQIDAYANITTDISIQSAESHKTGHITQAELNLGDATSGGAVELVIKSGITAKDLTLNTIDIQLNNKAQNGMGALSDEINRYSAITGISANAVVSAELNIKEGTTNKEFSINGINIGAIDVQKNDADNSLIKRINNKSSQHGVTASISSGGELILKSIDGRGIKITDPTGTVFDDPETINIGHINLIQKGASQFQIFAEISATGTTLMADTAVNSGTELKVGTLIKSGTTLADDMILDALSSGTGTSISSGATLSKDMYVVDSDITLTAGMTLKSGSVVAPSSTIKEFKSLQLTENMTLTEDMLVDTGTELKIGTLIKSGTTIAQDMILDALSDGTGTSTPAGALGSDMYIVDTNVILTADMTLKLDSVIELGSTTITETTTTTTNDTDTTTTINDKSYTLADISVLTQEHAQRSISITDAAMADINKTRSSLGSIQNQIISTISNLSVTKTNIQASESIIRDVDFAEEAMNFAKMQLLAQTGSYAMAQANASTQYILSLLQ